MTRIIDLYFSASEMLVPIVGYENVDYSMRLACVYKVQDYYKPINRASRVTFAICRPIFIYAHLQ
jgi:hypothetical protein